MNTRILKILLNICLLQIIRANSSLSTSNSDNLQRVKEFIKNKSITYYIEGGKRDSETLRLSKYLVSIRTRNPVKYFGDNHFCGGVIIAKKVVLTSCHCVMDNRRVLTRPRRVLLVAGTPNRLEPIETTVQFPVKSFVANTNFVKYKKDDIAIIHLKQEIPESNENIKILKMPTGPPRYNESCTVLGWGRLTVRGPLSAHPFHIQMRIQETWECRNFLKSFYYDGVICAIAGNDESPCLGDLGGPLICNDELTGIISFVAGCFWQNSPTIFTDIWHERDWIEKHLNRASGSHYKIFFRISIIVLILMLT